MLDRFPGFSTQEAELARAATLKHFRGKYVDLNTASPFSVKSNWVDGGKFRLTKAQGSAGVNVSYEPETVVRQYFSLDASGSRFQIGNAVHHLRGHYSTAIIPANTEFSGECFEDHSSLALRIEASALSSMMGAMLGEDPSNKMNFVSSAVGVSSERGLMRQAVLQLVAELDLMGPSLFPAALDALGQALIVKFLYFNPHVLSEKLRTDAPALSMTQARLIEAFIESRWDKFFNIEDMVRELQISARSIFRHFRLFRGQSPLAFQKHIRLLRSRDLLQTGDPDVSVTSIALRCGFSSLGRFARDYLDQFGELPSQTLRIAKRRGTI